MKIELYITYMDNKTDIFNVYIPKHSGLTASDLVYFSKDGYLEFDYNKGMTKFIPLSSIKGVNRIVTVGDNNE